MDTTQLLGVASTGASVVAAAVTAWMAVETRRMALAAKSALDLERQPVLGVRDLRVEFAVVSPNPNVAQPGPLPAQGVRVGVELFNAGRVPVRYRMKAMSVTFAGRATDAAQFLSKGGRILPGASTVFWHATVPLDPPVAVFPGSGRVVCAFDYGEDGASASREISETIAYTADGTAPGSRISWLYVDGSQTP